MITMSSAFRFIGAFSRSPSPLEPFNPALDVPSHRRTVKSSTVTDGEGPPATGDVNDLHTECIRPALHTLNTFHKTSKTSQAQDSVAQKEASQADLIDTTKYVNQSSIDDNAEEVQQESVAQSDKSTLKPSARIVEARKAGVSHSAIRPTSKLNGESDTISAESCSSPSNRAKQRRLPPATKERREDGELPVDMAEHAPPSKDDGTHSNDHSKRAVNGHSSPSKQAAGRDEREHAQSEPLLQALVAVTPLMDQMLDFEQQDDNDDLEYADLPVGHSSSHDKDLSSFLTPAPNVANKPALAPEAKDPNASEANQKSKVTPREKTSREKADELKRILDARREEDRRWGVLDSDDESDHRSKAADEVVEVRLQDNKVKSTGKTTVPPWRSQKQTQAPGTSVKALGRHENDQKTPRAGSAKVIETKLRSARKHTDPSPQLKKLPLQPSEKLNKGLEKDPLENLSTPKPQSKIDSILKSRRRRESILESRSDDVQDEERASKHVQRGQDAFGFTATRSLLSQPPSVRSRAKVQPAKDTRNSAISDPIPKVPVNGQLEGQAENPIDIDAELTDEDPIEDGHTPLSDVMPKGVKGAGKADSKEAKRKRGTGVKKIDGIDDDTDDELSYDGAKQRPSKPEKAKERKTVTKRRREESDDEYVDPSDSKVMKTSAALGLLPKRRTSFAQNHSEKKKASTASKGKKKETVKKDSTKPKPKLHLSSSPDKHKKEMSNSRPSTGAKSNATKTQTSKRPKPRPNAGHIRSSPGEDREDAEDDSSSYYVIPGSEKKSSNKRTLSKVNLPGDTLLAKKTRTGSTTATARKAATTSPSKALAMSGSVDEEVVKELKALKNQFAEIDAYELSQE